MTNKYLYFVANWKMYGDLKALNSLDKVINFSKSIKHKKLKLIYTIEVLLDQKRLQGCAYIMFLVLLRPFDRL